jgi:TolA-binding protein
LKLISKTRKGSRVIKKYDRAQTPYQRILASESVPEITKQKLTEQYQELDPVQLLEHITRLQDLLWQQAYVEREMTHRTNSSNPAHPKMARDSTSPPDGPSQENTNPPNAKLEMVERMYRRTKKKRRDGQGKRWWRTRTDPFAEVWEEVEQELEKAPYSNAKTLFEKFQKRYPGKFLDGQLRTFQRRVKDWRVRQANMQPSVEALSSNPFSVPKNGELG